MIEGETEEGKTERERERETDRERERERERAKESVNVFKCLFFLVHLFSSNKHIKVVFLHLFRGRDFGPKRHFSNG